MRRLLGRVNPISFLGLWPAPSTYARIPGHESSPGTFESTASSDHDASKHTVSQGGRSRLRRCRFPGRLLFPALLVTFLLLAFLYHPEPPSEEEIHAQEEAEHKDEVRPADYFWMVFPMLHGYYNGVYNLVSWRDWVPEELQLDQLLNSPYRQPRNNATEKSPVRVKGPLGPDSSLPLNPEPYNPYPDYRSRAYESQYHPVENCYLDDENTTLPLDIFAYPGVVQNTPMPFFGSYQELGLRNDICFDRFGRFGPYGYGYTTEEGGLGLGSLSERVGTEDMWLQQPRFNWTSVNWGFAQDRCVQKNRDRFDNSAPEEHAASFTSTTLTKIPRTAFLFRTWTGFRYTPFEILTLRSTINELALKSGGEYHVFLLLHVQDDTVPIWASREVAQEVIERNVPREFWNMTILWSVQQMRMYYPAPFDATFSNPSGTDAHEVYRGNHLPLQWFAAEHPEYDFVWNWEMDMRYTGHHYEFHDRAGKWARAQPRRGLWERNSKLWIPAYHGNWTNFTKTVDAETTSNGAEPIWGPVSFESNHRLEPPAETEPPVAWQEDEFEWGVGEEADLLTFNPIFDPSTSNWVFREDLSGYSLELPIPPRRCAIVTVARFSRRLLDIMHKETYLEKHSAFPEMWPPTVALHHGLKAVYVPHPIYFDRKWPLEYLDRIFNRFTEPHASPFGWGEHNFLGSSFYYKSAFSGRLWRRWLGEEEGGRGGHTQEKKGSGRMCVRSSLHHPIKHELSPE